MNPFVFSGASNLSSDQILKLFIHDYNYSRFIQSKRNFFFWGERGSGKTMTLLYNKLVIQQNVTKAINSHKPIEFIPVYVSCINPLVFKREFLLLDNKFLASVVSEHYLALSMGFALIDALLEIPQACKLIDHDELRTEFEYILDGKLPENDNSLKAVKSFLRKQFINTQKEINSPDSDSFYKDSYSFTSLLKPLIDIFCSMKFIENTHFIFMMDDAHDLNELQRATLNSWISYRDNSHFSFKVSAAKMSGYNFKTTSGGAILQGHDYTSVNMEQAFQNTDSGYSKMAKKIISKRLETIDFTEGLDDYFPENESFKAQIEEYKEVARKQAIAKYGEANSKKINDYVYKYARAIYFRERSSKANRPPYSGLETIIHLSSGIIRNLLEPCFIMYEDMLSETCLDENIKKIESNIQTDVISRLSDAYWERLRHGIDKDLPECSSIQAKQLENLFSALSGLFRDRLLDSQCSEPRAIAFTISAKSEVVMKQLQPILNLAQRAQLLYVRNGTAKDDGAKEDYFVPNKMLWPSRGLDPVGQHARVSIQARKLAKALETGKIPYSSATIKTENKTKDLFDD